MEINLTRIGNSQGVILPKTLITQYGFRERINLEPREGGLFISRAEPAKHPREGWAEAAKMMVEMGDDESVWPEDMVDDFDEEWVWDEPDPPLEK